MGHVLEWAPFRAGPGVSERDVVEAGREMEQEFLAKQAGFVSRRLMRATDGGYVDLVWWRSLEDAKRAIERAAESPTCSGYFKVMAPAEQGAGFGVLLFETVGEV